MKTLALTVVFLLGHSFATAVSPKTAKSKFRSIKMLVDIVMAQGAESELPSENASDLDVPVSAATNGRYLQKNIIFKAGESPDAIKHEFTVLFVRDHDSKKETPVALIWHAFTAKKDGDVIVVEGHYMRVDLDGKVQTIVRISGPVGNNIHERQDVNSSDTKKLLKHEFDFYTHVSVNQRFYPK